MKRRLMRWIASILVTILVVCTSAAYASPVATEVHSLYDLHYSLPDDWAKLDYEEDGTDYLYHFSDTSGDIGHGAVLAGALFDDYSAYTPREFYEASADELFSNADYSTRCEFITVSGYDAALMYSEGPTYEVGESSSATLLILHESCAYWLSFFTEESSAEDEWAKYVTNIYLGDNADSAYTHTTAPVAQFTTIKRGDKNDDVKALQLRLIALEYLSGSADGDFGPKTEKAVMAYQEEAGLPTTGECDYATYVSLNDDDAPAAPKPTATPKPTEKPSSSNTSGTTYIGNRNTKKFHYSWCSSVDQMKEKNKVSLSSRDAAISKGYVPCKRCDP